MTLFHGTGFSPKRGVELEEPRLGGFTHGGRPKSPPSAGFQPPCRDAFTGATVTSDAGLLAFAELDQAVDLTLMAHGALAMTTPGDTSMATLPEVEKLARGGGARVER